MNKPNEKNQVKDDLESLDLMLQDIERADPLYRPTNYWSIYAKKFIPEIKKKGLHDFRRRKFSVLQALGATDVEPMHEVLFNRGAYAPRKIRWLIKLASYFSDCKLFKKILNNIMNFYSGLELFDLQLLIFNYIKLYGDANNARSVFDFEISKIGNPENVFSISGKNYTLSILRYYFWYAYCCKFCDFNSLQSIMEIGGGSGKQIEVLKKLNPQLTFFVFDIPPQLYVCQQYLSALFPNSVVPYDETRKLKSIPKDNKGKIFIFGAWKLPELENFSYDLFWNSASFQEMEPNVVANYLNFVNKQSKKYVFLNENMEGKKTIAKKEGELGVLEEVNLEHYKKGIRDFKILDISINHPISRGWTAHKCSFWKRKNHKKS